MKKLIFCCLCVLAYILPAFAQEGHKLNTNIDASFGPHYFNSDRNNPFAGGISVGYEYDPIFFFGVEVGFRFGGFNQKVKYDNPVNPGQQTEDKYQGTYWAPYIAPKIYLPISYDDQKDRARFLYIENRFSCTRTNLDLDKITDMHGSANKFRIQYELRAGYQHPLSERWAFNCWLGYNSFDFSKVKPESVKFKNSTPLQVGIGFNYILKK